MKKIILTVVLSTFLPAMAIAEDKVMQNTNVNGSLMSKKHMMNANPNASVMTGKHMMSDNPYSSHSKSTAGATKSNEQVKKGYTVLKYKK